MCNKLEMQTHRDIFCRRWCKAEVVRSEDLNEESEQKLPDYCYFCNTRQNHIYFLAHDDGNQLCYQTKVTRLL